ncbi:RICIN domain-containing protein [Streptomyces sp. NPDC058525]|uniref:RICIN domain-containing protein n=1 Tax=Streptomyces sp. NPDC058525 TaxID=3346538 RepID=UPI0036477828
MTAIPATAPERATSWLRLLAAALATCCVALGILASPLTAAPANAAARADGAAPASGADRADGAALQGVNFTSVSNSRRLDVQNGSRADGAYVVTNSAPGHHQAWNLAVDPADFSFAIVNGTTGKCIDLSWPALRQQTCRGQKSQKWYFQPVAGSTTAFMIRNASDNSCLDLIANAQYDDAWTGQSRCHAGANQRWTTNSPAAWNLAVDHGAKACQKDPSSCSWAVRSEAPAAPLPKVCASAVWYNNSSSPVSQSFSVNKTTGWQSSIGTTLSSELGGGAAPALEVAVSTTLSFQNVWSGSTSVGDAIQVSVPPAQYGWVTLSVLARKVTGSWTFDARGFPWTAEDTVTVPVKDDPNGGATLYIANTSPTFTSCT